MHPHTGFFQGGHGVLVLSPPPPCMDLVCPPGFLSVYASIDPPLFRFCPPPPPPNELISILAPTPEQNPDTCMSMDHSYLATVILSRLDYYNSVLYLTLSIHLYLEPSRKTEGTHCRSSRLFVTK